MLNLSITLLGSFQASKNEESIAQFRTKSVQALLIYLVCESKRPSSREHLMELLWPGMPQSSAQANMRQTLYRLRKLIPEVGGNNGGTVPFLVTNRQTIQINPDADYFADVHQFTSLTESDPERAIELYRGNFLADFYLPDSETFEAWANSRREAYRRQVLEALESVTAVSIQNANYDKAIQLAQRQLEIDNLRESSHQQLMEAWAKNGRRQEALTHYGRLQKMLQDELAIEPSQETRTLIDAIRADDFSTVTKQIPTPDGASNTPKHNLPQQLTSFIGREKEKAAIINLLNIHRLVMLTGVGGIGKTNLSLQVGRSLLDTFPDGVWLVELAPITDPQLIPQTAVSALKLPDSQEQSSLQTLLNALKVKSCLLILDNCEHLIHEVAQFVQTLLKNCSDLKIIASSREPLGVPGEIPFHVPSLAMPEALQTISLDSWREYDALRLFAERATAVLPDFQVTANNLTPLIQICRRLDGIPLALELAAARVKVLTLVQIAERLNDRFRLLTGGSRTALPRQQTLRALIDWSWDLLTEREQLLLQRLSIFAGGMDLEAIEAVCVGHGLNEYDILDLLTDLVNKSLVISIREQGNRARYHLLETIRQYAQERLFMIGQGPLFRQRHLDYYWLLSQQAEQAFVGSNQVEWLNRLEKEWDNIRAALNWADETDPEKGLQLTTSLEKLWDLRGTLSEQEAWLTQLLSSPAKIKPAIRAKGLLFLGSFNHYKYHARQLIRESLSIYESLEDQEGIANCLRGLAWIADHLGERDDALSLFSNSLAIYRRLDNKLGLADILVSIGFFTGNAINEYEQAAVYLQESRSLYRELEHLGGMAGVSNASGQLALRQGDYHAAQMWLEESLEYHELLQVKQSGSGMLSMSLGELYFRLEAYEKSQRHLENSILIGKQSGGKILQYWGQVYLGYCFLWQGELEKAKTIFIESQQQFKSINQTSGVIFATEGLAILAIRWQQPNLAARLFAWTDAARVAFQDPRPPSEQTDVDRETDTILEMIDEDSYATAYDAGKNMTMEQAIDCTLERKT